MTRDQLPRPVKTIQLEVAKRVGVGKGFGGGVRSVEFRERWTRTTPPSCARSATRPLESMRDQRNEPIHAVRRCVSQRAVHACGFEMSKACRNIFVVFSDENSHRGQRSENSRAPTNRTQCALLDVFSRRACHTGCLQTFSAEEVVEWPDGPGWKRLSTSVGSGYYFFIHFSPQRVRYSTVSATVPNRSSQTC